MKRKMLLFILCLVITSLLAQTAEIDSLKVEVAATTGTAKVDAINNLSKAFWLEDPELSIENGNKALTLARKMNYKIGEAEAIKNIGGAHYYLTNYDTAVEYFIQSLNLRKKIGEKKDIINALNNLGMVQD